MKPETKRKIRAGIAWTVMGAATLAFATSCDNGTNTVTYVMPDPAGTIYAFGRTIKVKAANGISENDFYIAKWKLEYAFMTLENDPGLPNKPKFETMRNRDDFMIIIENGNAAPAANANKSMTVGVDYLKSKVNGGGARSIEAGIYQAVEKDLFAKAIVRDSAHMAKAQA